MAEDHKERQERYRSCLPWATQRQQDAIKALLRHGDTLTAAEKLGIHPSRLRGLLSEAASRAARAGYSPEHQMNKPVPNGYHVRGVSTYYDKDGQVRGQWVKSQKDQEHQIALLLDAVQDIAEPFRGKSIKGVAPKQVEKDLMAIYPMGDPHLGMYAWAAETGHDFDLTIAETNLVAAVDRLVGLAPHSELGVVINLGDFFHSDSADNQTRRSGHPLDVDTRWAKVLQVGIRTMRRCIDKALEKHQRVIVINEIGNHDDHSAVVLSLCLAQYYENNPRVEVDTSPSPFHWLRFGKTLIGVTHGNNTKPDMLPGIMAADRSKDWGETLHRYWYTGHVHHDTLKEFPGCTVETFRTLAARDAWHHKSGYRAGRDMKLDVVHKEHGRICRHIVGIEMLARPLKG